MIKIRTCSVLIDFMQKYNFNINEFVFYMNYLLIHRHEYY